MPTTIPFNKLSVAQEALLNGSEQTANKDRNGGYVGVASDGSLTAMLLVRHDTLANLRQLTPVAGEILVATDVHDLRYGDDVSSGGISVTLNTTSTVLVKADGSPAVNGQNLYAAYQLAKTLLPNGNAIGISNRVTVLVAPGVYDISNLAQQLDLDTAYIDLVSIGGKGCTFIITGNTLSLNLRVASTNVQVKGFTFQSANATAMLDLRLNNSTYWFEDLFFDTAGDTTKQAMTVSTATGGLNGTFRRCRTVGQQLFGGSSAIVLNGTFEDCEGGDYSFGGNTTLGLASQGVGTTGVLRRCLMTGTAWHGKFQGLMEQCVWSAPIERVANTPRFYANRFPIAGSTIINNNAAASIKSCQNRYGNATPLGSNITNSITTPYDVMDTNVT